MQEKNILQAFVGWCERSEIRHENLSVIGEVGGRSARSDLRYSLFTITEVIKNA